MSDNHDYLGTDRDPKLRLKADVLLLMLRGAGYAAIFCLAMVVFVWVISAIGKMLPDEAREAEDPTPFSYQLTPSDTDLV